MTALVIEGGRHFFPCQKIDERSGDEKRRSNDADQGHGRPCRVDT